MARVIPRREVQAAELVFQATARDTSTRAPADGGPKETIRKLEEAAEVAAAKRATVELELARAREQVLDRAHDEILDIAMAVARRVIGETLQERPELVRRFVQEATATVRRARSVRVRVHPEDVGRLAGVEVVPDPRLDRGDCIVESELGEVDARISARLDKLRDALEENRS